MFTDTPAFSSFSVDDLDAARAFYSDVLGLTIDEPFAGMLRLVVKDGNPILVYPKDDHVPATYTALNFPVKDVAAAADALAAKGVDTIKYPGTDERGINRDMGQTIAWFADPAGNILSILEV